eukprot:11798930-Alexandrium_andersonii.AAC.1
MGVPISWKFGPRMRLFRAFCALGPQPPSAGVWASAWALKAQLMKIEVAECTKNGPAGSGAT